MPDFPFVNVPKRLRAIVGDPDPGTRLYRTEGDEQALNAWSDAIFGEYGGPGLVSPGGVSMFAPVGRAAVHKALKDGRLTAFAFNPLQASKSWLGKTRITRTSAYMYIPVSECKAWAEDLKARRKAGETMEQFRARRLEMKGTRADLFDRSIAFGPSAKRKRSKR